MIDGHSYAQVRIRGLRLAALLLWAAGFAFSGGGPHAAVSNDPSLRPAVWVMADFNCDHKLDLAIVDPTNLDVEGSPVPNNHKPGCPSRARVDRYSVGAGPRLKGARPRRRLGSRHCARAVFHEPAAAWLNDGAGHFHLGDVDTVRFQLSHEDARTLASPERPLALSEIDGDSTGDAISSLYVSLPPRLSGAPLFAGCEDNFGFSHAFVHERGPPRKS